MQIGFIGLGAVVETAYLPALRRLGDVIDRCQGYDLDCSRALPGIQRCSSLSALLAEPLDTLFITTSSLQHLPVLERALASGISRIVVEKPIVANLEQAARLRALLRRSEGQVHEVQQLGDLEYRDEGYFLLRGEMLSLTPRELALLKVLMFRRTRPVSRQQLFEQVFSLSDDVSPESIELYIHRLRKKLQQSNVRITTLRGLGYLLECEPHEMG